MRLSISIAGLDAVQRGFATAPAYTAQAMQAAMHQATMLVQHEWMDNLNDHADTGKTSGSVHSDVFSTPTGVLGVVGSSLPTAVFLELGTKPHKHPLGSQRRRGQAGPPRQSQRLEAIKPWVKRKLGVSGDKEIHRVAYLVMRKISRTGTPARRPAARALKATRPQIVRHFELVCQRLAAHLAGAGGGV